MFDVIVIGAGPAGAQLAAYLEHYGANYLVLDAAENPGATFQQYPRHRKLISINKPNTGSSHPDFNLRHDWNSLLDPELMLQSGLIQPKEGVEPLLFTEYTSTFFPAADKLVQYMADYARKHQLKIEYEETVESIDKTDGGYVVTTNNCMLKCRQLVVATGVSKPVIPEITGIEFAEQYEDVSVEPSDFLNQRVLIIGKGNSAFETAENLLETASLIHVLSPDSLTMAWKSHYVGDLRAVNNNILDTYQLKSQNAILDAMIKSIEPEQDKFKVTIGYQHAEDEIEEIFYDRIICCTGFRFDSAMFKSGAKPDTVIDDRFPAMTERFESVNNPNMFFAGTITQSDQYRKNASGFIHGFRYNTHALAVMLAKDNHWAELPMQTLPMESYGLTEVLIERINTTSALWQQHGFIQDAIVFDRANKTCHCYFQMPVKWLQRYIQDTWGEDVDYVLLQLDFGSPIDGDPFNQSRIHKDNVARAKDSKFLHPILSWWQGDEQRGVHHMLEDLEANWRDHSAHIQPLHQWLDELINAVD